MKTVNYVSITREHSSVRETLIIDPSLFIPLFLRPPLSLEETEETRKNLRLESTHGHVEADITLAEATNNDIQLSKRNSRVTMLMRSTHGRITAKIVSLLSCAFAHSFLNLLCSMDNPIAPRLYSMRNLLMAIYVCISHAIFMALSL